MGEHHDGRRPVRQLSVADVEEADADPADEGDQVPLVELLHVGAEDQRYPRNPITTAIQRRRSTRSFNTSGESAVTTSGARK